MSKISVIQVIDDKDEEHVKMIIRTLTGCEQTYACAVLHKRTEFILELEEGLPTPVLLAACAETNFSPGSSTNKFTMLLKENLGIEPCPVSGVHNVTSLSLDSQTDLCDLKAFSRLEIGCSSSEHVQFIRECSGNDLSMSPTFSGERANSFQACDWLVLALSCALMG